MTVSFHIPANGIFSNHLVILCYIKWATDRDVKWINKIRGTTRCLNRFVVLQAIPVSELYSWSWRKEQQNCYTHAVTKHSHFWASWWVYGRPRRHKTSAGDRAPTLQATWRSDRAPTCALLGPYYLYLMASEFLQNKTQLNYFHAEHEFLILALLE